MTILSVLHAFVSGKGDGPDTTRVKPSNWNAEHELVVDGDGVVLGRPAGAGPGAVEAISVGESGLIPTGIIVEFAGGVAPAGWLMCFGQLLDRTVEANLFAVIGTTYGAGDGLTTFNAPDKRGVVSAGKTDMGGADKGNLAGGNVLGAILGGQNSAPISAPASGSISGSASGALFGQVDGNSVGGLQFGGGGVATQSGDPVSVSGTLPVGGSFSGSAAVPAHSIVQGTMVGNFIIKR